MKKFYFFAALVAGIALTSCTSEDDLALSPPEVNVEDSYAPIVFSSLKNNITRGDITGKAAADSLGGKFVVSGFKGEKTATPGSMVFDNYLVEYGENTANTTESNSSNWEYVGKGLIDHAVTNGITKQTIKYWDYSQDQYDFIAWSTGKKTPIYTLPDDGVIPTGSVLVSNIIPNSKTPNWTAGDDPTRPAYTFEGKAADLKDCYIADIVTVKKADYGSNPVTIKFRSLGTKVRIGIYETVPGYSVKEIKFYTKGGLLTKTGDVLDAGQIVDNATIFSEGADIYTEGTYTVFYPTVDIAPGAEGYDDNNQAHIKFTPKSGAEQAKTVDWGTMNYTIRESGEKEEGAVYLGRSSNTASYAGNPDNNYYVYYLPNETGANLNLRVDFKLESVDGSGEIIEVKNAKAQVPSIYTTWKPGFAYTYLFKISDKTNGRTGVYDPTQADDATINSDPAGLYPITFDAIVINAEDNDQTQETITLVDTPSITTYQQNSTVVNADEYTVNGKDIYVTVNEGDAIVDLKTADATPVIKAALYTIEDGMTEAEVIDALTYQDDDHANGTIKGRSGKVLTEVTMVEDKDNFGTGKWMLTDSVKFGADGNRIYTGGDYKALRFAPSVGTYAFVYIKDAGDAANNVDYFEALAWDGFETGATKYHYAYLATTPSHSVVDDNGTPADYTDDTTTDYYDAQKGVKYFTANDATAQRVVEPFIGQGVSNLYLDENGTTIAKGYAVSGTDYYYTVNGGQSYIKAENVAIASFATATDIGTGNTDATWSVRTGDTPAANTPYYKRTGNGTTESPYVYTYCVFLPMQVNGKYILDEDKTHCVEAEETSAVDGQTYFDKYTKNDAERYVKVIKVAATN